MELHNLHSTEDIASSDNLFKWQYLQYNLQWYIFTRCLPKWPVLIWNRNVDQTRKGTCWFFLTSRGFEWFNSIENDYFCAENLSIYYKNILLTQKFSSLKTSLGLASGSMWLAGRVRPTGYWLVLICKYRIIITKDRCWCYWDFTDISYFIWH